MKRTHVQYITYGETISAADTKSDELFAANCTISGLSPENSKGCVISILYRIQS